MAKIEIYESDKTKRTAQYLATVNSVYVPGFTINANAPKTITLCKTVKEFEDLFGKEAYQFKVSDSVTLGAVKINVGLTQTGNENIISHDRAYMYAKDLLSRGIYIYYDAIYISESTTPLKDFYKKLIKSFSYTTSDVVDKNSYNIKFLTTGGYPNFGATLESELAETLDLHTAMLKTATHRGDCVALIDYPANHGDDASSIYNIVKDQLKNSDDESTQESIWLLPTNESINHKEDIRKYGAMFLSGGSVKLNITDKVVTMPGSFVYLSAFADSVVNNPNYYAIAGVTRGAAKNLLQPNVLVNAIMAETMQPDDNVAVNPITIIHPYNYCIWGNRTLYYDVDDLTASSFLNIRVLACDVKKIVRDAALKLNFEMLTDVLWLNFKSMIEPQLDKIVANNGLERYKLTRVETSERAKLKAIITLYCVYAVEKWDIEIELTDSYVSVE